MICELCGGIIDNPEPGQELHWSCLDRVLESLGPRGPDENPGRWAIRCPDIRPDERGAGHIVRKAIW